MASGRRRFHIGTRLRSQRPVAPHLVGAGLSPRGRQTTSAVTPAACRLDLTDEGVRYHLRNIYRKTGASKRSEVARYAESIGVEF